MSRSMLRVVAISCALACPAGALAQPDSGTRWEMKMNMPGMEDMAEQMKGIQLPPGVQLPPGMQLPGMGDGPGMMTQQMCMSKDTRKPPPPKEDCKLLEQRSTGNKHFMKMQCPEGLMEMTQTRTATTLHADMKLTDASGEVNQMTMDGRVLGDCDYAAEHAEQEQQIAGVKQQIADAQRQGDEMMAKTCDEGLAKMQGFMFGKDGMCAKRKADFCARLQTQEGYTLFTANTPKEGVPNVPGWSRPEQLQTCGFSEPSLLARFCPAAASRFDFVFVGANCPSEQPRLCDEALRREEIAYIGDHCATARAGLVAEHCTGRKYSSQIAPKYRALCTGALGADLKGGN